MFAGYYILRNVVYRPLRVLIQFLMIRTRPLETLLLTYGADTVVINGVKLLGAEYALQLAEIGYRDFILIGDDDLELKDLKSKIIALSGKQSLEGSTAAYIENPELESQSDQKSSGVQYIVLDSHLACGVLDTDKFN